MRQNPFRGQVIGLALFVGLALLIELAVLGSGSLSNAARAAAIAAAALGAFALIMLVVLVFLGRAYAPKIETILGGAYWVHWRYDMAEWERFTAQERQRNRRVLRWIVALVGAAILIDLAFSSMSAPGPDWPNLLYLIFLGVAALLALVYNLGSWSLYSWRRERRNEVYIGPLGVYRPDGYVPLRGVNRKLLRVAMLAGDPAIVMFSCQVRSVIGLVPVKLTIPVRVPVPLGREDEARALVTRFGTELAAR